MLPAATFLPGAWYTWSMATTPDTVLLVRSAQAGDSAAQEALLESYAGIFHGLAKQHATAGSDLADLVLDGQVAFLECLAAYDEARGAALLTYAYPHIRKAIADAAARDRSLVYARRPDQRWRRAATLREDHFKTAGVWLSDEEVLRALGFDPTRISDTCPPRRVCAGGEDEIDPLDACPADDDTAAEALPPNLAAVRAAVLGLPSVHGAFVLAWCAGLLGDEGGSLRVLAGLLAEDQTREALVATWQALTGRPIAFARSTKHQQLSQWQAEALAELRRPKHLRELLGAVEN